MVRTPRKVQLCAAALALLAVACARAESFELRRVQKADVRVLPGSEGFTHPLTGIVSYTPQDWQDRSLLAIKVGNSSAERPQAGLSRADLIYEEIVEGGVTRFMAVFSTNQAPRVGPVRSVRNVDTVILQPFQALFGYSGGVPPVVSKLRSTSGVTDVGANVVGDAYIRDDARNQPYNLYTSTDKLWEQRSGKPPGPQFDFLSTADDPTTGGDEVANEVKFAFAGNSSEIRFTFDKKTGLYKRHQGEEPHLVEGNGDGEQLTFRNVVMQMVDTTAGSTTDTKGQRSTESDLIGSGSVVLFRGGRALRGTWQRSTPGERTKFIDASGQPLRFAPGETIIELLPRGRDIFVS